MRLDGCWTKYECDGCQAHALAPGCTLPPGWQQLKDGRHCCSEECGAVLSATSTEPTPTSGVPVMFMDRICSLCGKPDCDEHFEPG